MAKRRAPKSSSIIGKTVRAVESGIGYAISALMSPGMKPKGHLIFVYGALSRGKAHHEKLAGSEFLGTVKADGFIRVHGPGGTAISPGRGTVTGEAYDVDTATLRRIDAYEWTDLRRQKIRLSNGAVAWTWVLPVGSL
jgi:gamma-glutamylcyclotransferase (GGCT)/AIG2-like uncharacterized protein YtfP